MTADAHGYGCSLGRGAGYGNAGYMKGVEIELHTDILSYGQEIDIKHIHKEGGLINHAVAWAMNGVDQAVIDQQAAVNEAQY